MLKRYSATCVAMVDGWNIIAGRLLVARTKVAMKKAGGGHKYDKGESQTKHTPSYY